MNSNSEPLKILLVDDTPANIDALRKTLEPEGFIIHVNLGRVDGMAKVSVRDEVPGIPLDEQSKMFQGFQKTSVRPTGGERSAGLGLAIIKKIVEAHKGNIGLVSQPGNGSTFYFCLPLA